MGEVYPRVCGGTRPSISRPRSSPGLSPRVRGNQRPAVPHPGPGRSIPACAGEPGRPPPSKSMPGVYPRVCGGTMAIGGLAANLAGLSPRVRGNPSLNTMRPELLRSIPACAGEPDWAQTPSNARRVYPRVCGGTESCAYQAILRPGLSPRVRGNRRNMDANGGKLRSIPACAGEPMADPAKSGKGRVYPRVCGGTPTTTPASSGGGGLSPRVRGNPPRPSHRWQGVRSIPACAGEPICPTGSGRNARVYPRVCGGTVVIIGSILPEIGLSPRVRGNRVADASVADRQRSIPACAGEPVTRKMTNVNIRVYPRVCGGTAVARRPAASIAGLSPRVRGNRQRSRHHLLGQRSIPACAGEPTPGRRMKTAIRVYPRVCGGTRLVANRVNCHTGLSPRVRGNLHVRKR